MKVIAIVAVVVIVTSLTGGAALAPLAASLGGRIAIGVGSGAIIGGASAAINQIGNGQEFSLAKVGVGAAAGALGGALTAATGLPPGVVGNTYATAARQLGSSVAGGAATSGVNSAGCQLLDSGHIDGMNLFGDVWQGGVVAGGSSFIPLGKVVSRPSATLAAVAAFDAASDLGQVMSDWTRDTAVDGDIVPTVRRASMHAAE